MTLGEIYYGRIHVEQSRAASIVDALDSYRGVNISSVLRFIMGPSTILLKCVRSLLAPVYKELL